MASWGYIQVVPDVRPIDFGDERFNARNTEIITRTFDLVADNAEGINADPQRIGVGGYSAGGSHAAFAAGREPRTKALVMWVPAPALVWQGIDPAQELPNVTAPSLFMLAEFDSAAGTWPVEMQGMMGESEQTIYTVAGGIHMYFQQPQFPPCHPGALPRLQAQIPLEEQQFQALTETRRFLDETLGIEREE
jgi:dienelactone hydrolase